MRISDDHADHLIQHGYTVVKGFLSAQELAAARANMLRYYPTAMELAAQPERYPWVLDDPEHLQNEFPFSGHALNHQSTHPDLIDFVERLLGTKEVLLSQAAIWAKYAGTGDFDQEMHLDYEGNTLVVPRDEGTFRQVNMILYHTDVDATMGPTCVVPKEKARNLSMWPAFRSREEWPKLYKQERQVLAAAGDLFIFAMGTFHRASNMTAEAGVRFSHHMVWRAAAHPFAGYHQWSQFGEKPEMSHFLERATPRQREMLGFPAPGHPYWTKATVAGVAARYPNMDMTPYGGAAPAPPSPQPEGEPRPPTRRKARY